MNKVDSQRSTVGCGEERTASLVYGDCQGGKYWFREQL